MIGRKWNGHGYEWVEPERFGPPVLLEAFKYSVKDAEEFRRQLYGTFDPAKPDSDELVTVKVQMNPDGTMTVLDRVTQPLDGALHSVNPVPHPAFPLPKDWATREVLSGDHEPPPIHPMCRSTLRPVVSGGFSLDHPFSIARERERIAALPGTKPVLEFDDNGRCIQLEEVSVYGSEATVIAFVSQQQYRDLMNEFNSDEAPNLRISFAPGWPLSTSVRIANLATILEDRLPDGRIQVDLRVYPVESPKKLYTPRSLIPPDGVPVSGVWWVTGLSGSNRFDNVVHVGEFYYGELLLEDDALRKLENAWAKGFNLNMVGPRGSLRVRVADYQHAGRPAPSDLNPVNIEFKVIG